jgi:hypothetical protein
MVSINSLCSDGFTHLAASKNLRHQKIAKEITSNEQLFEINISYEPWPLDFGCEKGLYYRQCKCQLASLKFRFEIYWKRSSFAYY